MLAFLILRIRATKLRNLMQSLVSKSSTQSETMSLTLLTELAAVELSPTSEEFDCIRIVARNSSGNIVTIPVKVRPEHWSIVRAEYLYIQRTGYLSSARVRSELGSCIRGLGRDLSMEIYFTV